MTLALLGSEMREVFQVPKDPHGREPFEHPAIDGIEVLNGGTRPYLLHHKQISALSQQYGLQNVIRWNPRKVCLLHQIWPSDLPLTTDAAARKSSGLWNGSRPYTSSLRHRWSYSTGKRRSRGESNNSRTNNWSFGSTATKGVGRSASISSSMMHLEVPTLRISDYIDLVPIPLYIHTISRL
jgi:hypothetical protein